MCSPCGPIKIYVARQLRYRLRLGLRDPYPPSILRWRSPKRKMLHQQLHPGGRDVPSALNMNVLRETKVS